VHNVGVRTRLLPLVALVSAALALTGCSGSKDDATATASSSSASPSPSSTVQVPDGQKLTPQGTKLSFGDTATVIFESTQNKGTVLRMRVEKVQKGDIADFKGFILDDDYKKKASYYYATVAVSNVGDGDVGGVGVPLWGVNSANTLLPAVNFTTSFPKCPSKPLPATFTTGDTLQTCLVYLSPDKGDLTSVSYRPNQQFDPITWTGDIASPSPK